MNILARAVWFALALLAASVAIELWSPLPSGDQPIQPTQPVSPRITATPPDRTGHDATEALARPLFIEGRRPPSAASVQAVAQPAEALPRLSGVMIAGSRRLAIFVVGDASVAGGIGDAIGAQRIVGITPATVTLQGPSGVRTLSLAFDPKQVVPVPPAPSILDQLNSGQRAPAVMPKPVSVEDLMATLPKSPMNLAGSTR